MNDFRNTNAFWQTYEISNFIASTDLTPAVLLLIFRSTFQIHKFHLLFNDVCQQNVACLSVSLLKIIILLELPVVSFEWI
ncbi:hypothetical protein T07_5051 [Trichinella nelsoni]|uniref:Uncharacterized protein n=1 Tax=Trichinella nelsoni TaxID=6336 RepID=A0A0V0RIK0_9BILA|nr:hypothetical protein T07_5051 [Trichinella nelsoni]